MQKLNDSISKNQEASEENKRAADPLPQPKPSDNYSGGDNDVSVESLREQYS